VRRGNFSLKAAPRCGLKGGLGRSRGHTEKLFHSPRDRTVWQVPLFPEKESFYLGVGTNTVWLRGGGGGGGGLLLRCFRVLKKAWGLGGRKWNTWIARGRAGCRAVRVKTFFGSSWEPQGPFAGIRPCRRMIRLKGPSFGDFVS